MPKAAWCTHHGIYSKHLQTGLYRAFLTSVSPSHNLFHFFPLQKRKAGHPSGKACASLSRGLNTSPVPPESQATSPTQSRHPWTDRRAAALPRVPAKLQRAPRPADILLCTLALPSAGLKGTMSMILYVLRTAVRRWLCCMKPGRVKPHLNISFP